MIILSKHDLISGFSRVAISGKQHDITKTFGYCTGRTEKDLFGHVTKSREASLTEQAALQFPGANAVVVTVTRGNDDINGRALYIDSLPANNGAVG